MVNGIRENGIQEHGTVFRNQYRKKWDEGRVTYQVNE